MSSQSHLPEGTSRAGFIALVAALMALNAMAIDIMLPAFPQLTESLALQDANQTQFVLTTYMAGFGIGQLALGPLSDRYGRRAPLIWGLGLYIIAAFAAVFSPNFTVLLILRMLQGLGAAATRIVAVAVVRDTHSGRAMAEVMSLVFMVFMIVPIVAPAIGQLLVQLGPWHLIFVIMSLMGLAVALWSWFKLPETLAPENKRELRFSVIVDGFRLVFSNRQAMMYGLAPGVMFGALFAFLGSAQAIYDGIYGLGALFPAAFATVAGFMAMSSLLNARIVRVVGMRRLSHGALTGFILLSGVWMIWSFFGDIPLPGFLALVSTIMFMFGMIANNFNSMSMEPLGKVAGTASSVFGFLQTFGGAVLGAAIGLFYNGSTTTVAIGYFSLGLLALVLVLIAEDGKLFGVSEEYAN